MDERSDAPTTFTTIAAVTPCRRRCDSSTVSRHRRTDERTNERTDGRTDAGNIIFCILALKCDIGCNNFNDFPDNYLTRYRVIYWLIPDLYLSFKFLWSIAVRSSIGWTPLQTQRTDKRTNDRTDAARPSHSWSLKHTLTEFIWRPKKQLSL